MENHNIYTDLRYDAFKNLKIESGKKLEQIFCKATSRSSIAITQSPILSFILITWSLKHFIGMHWLLDTPKRTPTS